MKAWKKYTAVLALAGTIAGTPLAAAEASSVATQLIYGAAAMAYVSHYYSKLDDEGGEQFLGQYKEQTGVYDDYAADARIQTIYQNFRETGDVKREYNLYAAPDEDINAFMSLGGVMCVYKGALDAFDDDELAYVMAHELAHGEKRHSLSGVKKKVGLSTAINVYLAANDSNIGTALLANVAGNYVANAVFTKDQEKQADDLGFDYLVDAGYNPGGAAASMAVLRERYGESTPTGIKAVLAPGNHPATSDRVNKNIKRMYEYSGKHVNVKDGEIVVNGQKAFAAVESGNYTAEERTYLTAGKLAKLYHDDADAVTEATYDGDAIYIGQTEIYTVSGEEDGNALAAALNDGIAKK